MAAPAPDMITATSGLFYFPEVTRESSAAKIAEVGRPILRPSSQTGYYAFSYYDVSGSLKHGLVRAALVDDRGSILAMSVPELVERIKTINPTVYSPTEPRPLRETFMVGRGRNKTRRTVRRRRR